VKKDGFEIVAFNKDKPISIKYKDYDDENKQKLTYIVPNDKIEHIENALKNHKSLSDFFVKLDVENINTRNISSISLFKKYI